MSIPEATVGAAEGTDLPLSGMRIVELASIVAGPSVGKHLSDFGAEVIKIERPEVGDSTREMGQRLGGRSAWWVVIGRNKRSVTLNLKQQRGRDAFLRVCATADALVESQRPGVLERLGLGPAVLHEHNPGLVIVRISGFGQSGPYAMRPGFGTLAEAFSGLASVTGNPGDPPMLAPTAIADEVAGLFATWALLMALYHRDVSGGSGQVIDVSLFEALFSVLGPLPTLFQQTAYEQKRFGSRLPWTAPRNVYASKDGEHFVISGTAPGPAAAILRLIGGEALATDPRFSTAESRSLNADELDRIVGEWIAERTHVEVTALFEAHGIAGARVLNMRDVFQDPHFQARSSVVEVHDEELGDVALQAPVPRLSDTPGRIRHTGPALGSATESLLAELGFDEREIASGRQEGAW